MEIKGFDTRYAGRDEQGNAKWDVVTEDLYIIGIFDENDNVTGHVYSGRPHTLRVCHKPQIKNVIRAAKGNAKGTLKPIRLLTGVIEDEY